MPESRTKDALIKLLKTVETVKTVDIVKTVEAVVALFDISISNIA